MFDEETGFYYVSSRYYDPEIGRFISPDTTDVLTATPMGLTDKNLYPRGVRSGIRQLQKYNKDLGGGFILFPDSTAPSACAFSLLASAHST